MALERMIDMRPQADRLIAVKLTGKSGHHAKRRPLTADGKAAPVAALPEVAAGRAGLLADVALGFCQRRRPYTPGSGHAVLFSLVSGLRGSRLRGLGAVVSDGAGAAADCAGRAWPGRPAATARPGTPTATASRQPSSDQFLSA